MRAGAGFDFFCARPIGDRVGDEGPTDLPLRCGGGVGLRLWRVGPCGCLPCQPVPTLRPRGRLVNLSTNCGRSAAAAQHLRVGDTQTWAAVAVLVGAVRRKTKNNKSLFP